MTVIAKHPLETTSFDTVGEFKKAYEKMGFKEVNVKTEGEEWVVTAEGREKPVKKTGKPSLNADSLQPMNA